MGMVHNRVPPSSNDSDDVFNNDLRSLSYFNDINKMMAKMHQRFQRLFGLSSFPMAHDDDDTDLMEDRKQLDAIKPNCTTSVNNSSRSVFTQRNQRKTFRPTQTTTCIKELINGEKKQIYKEMNITDDKGILISQSKIYQTMSINTSNDTKSIDSSASNQDVISY